MGNEIMTAYSSPTAPFSRMTMAFLKDSGWYEVDYEEAENFAWGY